MKKLLSRMPRPFGLVVYTSLTALRVVRELGRIIESGLLTHDRQ
ncbi:hypothetical protein SAMN03159423_4980 [Bradyrhizobium sp. NFR13]|jgi:hypothetical protein|nr:hypothetical protein SAMN03159423_4980 [Bradyrhizobium sp. NFR13]